MRIGFIGGGTMATAIMARVLDRGLASPSEVVVGEPVEARRAHLAHEYGVAVTGNNPQAAADADLVVLAVKPQDLPAVMAELRECLQPGQTILSIVAGAKLGTLRRGLDHAALVRVMPNTPAQVGAGMSVWTATPEVPSDRVEATRGLLGAIGEETYVADERYLDMATALSASGPAFVLLFLEAMIDAGVHVGLPRPMAEKLAGQTVLGTAQLAVETGTHPAALRNMVTSPGGTTAEGLLALEDAGLRAAVLHAVLAAHEKSKLLGGED